MSNRVRWVVAGIVVVVAATVVAVLLLRPSPGPSPVSPAAGVSAPSMQEVSPERLVGRWLRSDGGYVLEIRRAEPDGRLDAAYLNPRSIHVARAEWRREGDSLTVFIELRDVNYPGSTYRLAFSPGPDRLTGAYFQAVERHTFDVMFMRQ
jgi:hypothetical protein